MVLLTKDDVKAELQVGRRIAARVIAELPAVRFGPKTVRFPQSALERWVEEHALAPEDAA